jgi:membrane-associated protease RseP (regulator of RpoE activity)
MAMRSCASTDRIPVTCITVQETTMTVRFRTAALSAGIALSLAFGALAQTADNDAEALEAAQAELERAAARVAELSRKLGRPPGDLLIQRRTERRPVLGVVLAPDERSGVRVAGVTPDSGAAKAGLRSGDRIVSIDGRALSGTDGAARTEQARRRLAQLDAGKPVAIEYERNGTRASVRVTPQLGERALVLADDRLLRLDGPVGVFDNRNGDIELEASGVRVRTGPDAPVVRRIVRHEIRGTDGGDIEEIELAPAPGVAPRVHREIVRLRADSECTDAPCRLPLIADALRWNGLNLASVDAKLGRYFGTDRGVLVLSSAPAFDGLQAGDVIQRIDGTPVMTPREAMAALRAHAPGKQVDVRYLRDHKAGTARMRVPEAPILRTPVAPPAPPAPPSPAAPPAPDAPPAPLAPPAPAVPDAPPVPGSVPAPPAPQAPDAAPTSEAPPAPPAPPSELPVLVLV